MKRTIALGAVLAAGAWLIPAAAAAQQAGNPNDPWCGDRRDRDRGYYCEVREMSVARPALLTVDASPNGGIKIVGTSRGDVHVRARVSANADTNEQALAVVGQVSIQAGATINAQGPDGDGNRGWSVSYEISVPTDQALSLNTLNGGIAISGVRADAEFTTHNGGINLSDVGGKFKGRTTNGGVHVSLKGSGWEGAGLDVTTRNGGIVVQVPDGFAAHLEASTSNGGVRTDLPVATIGTVSRRQVTGDLNGGGATLRLTTTNGGVAIQRRSE